MQHATVVSRLMSSQLALFFQKGESEIALAKQELVRRGQSDDSAANDDEIVSFGHDEVVVATCVSGNGIPNRWASDKSET